jgi:TRAP-type mannitol/chloroaromatic compound transport system substrate-binding protein
MKRKEFIKKAIVGGLAAPVLATGCVPSPSSQKVAEDAPNVGIIGGKRYQWKLVTTWPPNFAVLGEGAQQFANWIAEMTGGRIEIKVYGAGELVPALEAFDAVRDGIAEMGSSSAYYWAGKSPAMPFFSAVPFGMNAQQLTSWLLEGGGYDLWKELYAQFDVIPLLAGNSGVQMGGWFNKAINTVDDLKGLKMRIPGIAGKVLEKAGGAPILVAGGEIYTSLERGVIDATEWLHPYHDYKMGFHKIAKYYYAPGWHEPGTQLELLINRPLYESLPKDLQAIIWAASMRLQVYVLSAFDAANRTYYQKLLKDSKVEIRMFPKEVLAALRRYTKDVIEATIESDAFSKKVYASYAQFQAAMKPWYEISEKAYYNDVL